MFGLDHWYNFSHVVNEPQRPLTPKKVELHQHPKEERAGVRQKKTGGRDRKEGGSRTKMKIPLVTIQKSEGLGRPESSYHLGG